MITLWRIFVVVFLVGLCCDRQVPTNSNNQNNNNNNNAAVSVVVAAAEPYQPKQQGSFEEEMEQGGEPAEYNPPTDLSRSDIPRENIPEQPQRPLLGKEMDESADKTAKIDIPSSSTKKSSTGPSSTVKDVEVLTIPNLLEISHLLRNPTQSPALQQYLSFPSNVTFVLTLVYSSKCQASAERQHQFTRQIPRLWKGHYATKSLPPPVLVLLPVDRPKPLEQEEDETDSKEYSPDDDTNLALVQQIESFGISHVPSLLWMLKDTSGNTFVLDFVATESLEMLTAEDILQTFQHLQSRLLLLISSLSYDGQTGTVTVHPRHFSTLRNEIQNPTRSINQQNNNNNNETQWISELESWFLQHGSDVFRPLVQIFPPSLSDMEQGYARWLWNEPDDETADEGFLLLGQCRWNDRPEANTDGDDYDDDNDEKAITNQYALWGEFDRLASAWINRRDVAMVTLSDCPRAHKDKEEVYVWRINSTSIADATLDLSWEAAERVIAVDSPEGLKNALLQTITPTLLWLDRDMTAPIAFPIWRKVHAVLVIDMHRVTTEEGPPTALDRRQAAALGRLRRACRQHQRNPLLTEDIVCLVVPSTDIRTLTIFGIDIWTPMDLVAWQPQENHPDPEILPIVFLTDQRFGGTRRYYLDKESLDVDDKFDAFWNHFWQNGLVPFQKSSPSSRTNKAGIRILAAAEFNHEIFSPVPGNDKRKHKLILFTSSMCGHCRRLMALWNQFGRLVQRLSWSSFLTLYQVDVSIDEVTASDLWNETIRWVPDLVYVFEPEKRIVRYEEKDDHGDHVVGNVKSYLHLVEWFLHKATLTHHEIRQLLLDVQTMRLKENTQSDY